MKDRITGVAMRLLALGYGFGVVYLLTGCATSCPAPPPPVEKVVDRIPTCVSGMDPETGEFYLACSDPGVRLIRNPGTEVKPPVESGAEGESGEGR